MIPAIYRSLLECYCTFLPNEQYTLICPSFHYGRGHWLRNLSEMVRTRLPEPYYLGDWGPESLSEGDRGPLAMGPWPRGSGQVGLAKGGEPWEPGQWGSGHDSTRL